MKYLMQSMSFVLLCLALQTQARQYHPWENMPSVDMAVPGDTTVSFTVYGNCGMCKQRIEGALKDVTGVHSTAWDADTQIMDLSYDPAVVSLDDIQKKIAEAGHDTDKYRARDEAYQALPGCCQYQRPKN